MKKQKSRITWKLERRKLEDLMPHPQNPRIFTEKGMKDLENSINSIGFAQPINVNRHNTILSGHARVMKLKDMGIEEVDVYVPDCELSAKQEEEILVRMNANSAGEFDMERLANEFELTDLDGWGLEIPEINNIEDHEKKDLSDSLEKRHILEIECDGEAEQEILYNRFLGEGLKCKILTL